MKLSIVIVNYNVRHFLEQCLRSVERAIEGVEAEVWVVDNASSDQSVEMVRQKFPRVHCIDNGENMGFARANNQAVNAGNSPFVLLLNPDTILPEDNIRKALAYMDEHPECGALGVKMIDGRGKYLPESKRGLPTPWVAFYKIFGLAALFPKSRKFGRYHLGHLNKEQNHRVDILAGAYMFIRRQAWEDAGGLDEQYFMYGEDIDLSHSIKMAGWEVHYLADAPIIHYKGESTRKGSMNYVFMFYQAMLIFARKHFSSQYARVFGVVIRLAIYLRAALSLVRRMFNRIVFPLVDLALFVAGMQFIIRYWELNHRFIQGGAYPEHYRWIIIPAYGLIWVTGMALLGAYRRPVRLNRLISGLALGTGIIFAAYALSPEYLRFSRALIILGAGWMVFSAVLSRLVISLIPSSKMGWWRSDQRRVAWLGPSADEQAVRALLNLEEEPVVHMEPVGMDDWERQARILDLNELVFDSRRCSYGEMVALMERFAGSGLRFKVAYPNEGWIIGSDSIHEAGTALTSSGYALAQPEVQRSKRLFDLLAVLFLWILTPIAIWAPRWRKLWWNSFRVLGGVRTWVGYSGHAVSLPRLRPGVLPVKDLHDDSLSLKVDEVYAAHYDVNVDVRVLIRHIRGSGKNGLPLNK